ncbi:MAG: cell surface protein SprA [Bacteroidaceae bacterium]|nr:cell surface protein SprA [Bacteroidaceae bacterium]
MNKLRYILIFIMTLAMVFTFAATYSPSSYTNSPSTSQSQLDTLSHVKVKKTDYTNDEKPIETSLDLATPENIAIDTAIYDEKQGFYRVGTRLGDNFLSAPYIMTPEEYLKWNERKSINRYFRERNDSLFARKGKEKFDFTDMHFDLGPAEKIFGPGGVRIKTNGSAELKFGYNYKYTDNPSLTERNRTVKNFDFDEKININVNASIGDKMDFNLNYNTESTFDYDAKNLKLSYEGKEDEIVRLLEAGNVSFPSNNSLVRGSQSLFGIRTDLQFGKLNLQTVVSQKKSKSQTVASKGGAQLTPFEIQAYNYDENRHFFIAQYFRDQYDIACATLPTITSGVTINRVEIWVTNTSGATENTRDIVGFVDLAEHDKIYNNIWTPKGTQQPQNQSNTLYSNIIDNYPNIRSVDKTSSILDQFLVGGVDYEKVENARLLSSNEYTLNKHLGYISLKSTLQTNNVLAISYEYTYGGNTYQVGEFSSDIKDNDKALIVKLLKNTSNSPKIGNWDLMMKNVYSLNANSVQKEKFKLDIKYQSDTTGVTLSYIPEPLFKNTTILKMMNLDRLDDNMKTNPNGKFDFIDGYTIEAQNGRIVFPVVEPFGQWLRDRLKNDQLADKYCYDELYDSTKTVAKQVAEKNKFTLEGEYKASSGSEIDLGSMNIPQGSVVVTAGGVTLTEGTDYTVNYSAGKVNIINQSIIDAGTNVSVSLESQSDFSLIRKTMLGVNWTYDFSKNFQLGGTYMHLSEQAQTTKVKMGDEPLNNTIWGLHLNWKQQSQWLTNLIDKLPLINVSQPSSINFNAEFAQLIAGKTSGVQGNASYLDDFEETKSGIDESRPSSWGLSSTPSHLTNGNLKNDVKYGYNRARLAWYSIDPLFTRRSSSLTPSHLKNDLEQLSNHYVREVYVREVYPNRDTNSGESNTLPILNVAYYPSERGPYNLDTDVDRNGNLNNPASRWGGMTKKIDASDFETSNVQYVEFWMLDPFIYTNKENSGKRYGGDLYFNLGDISEDVLKDGKKSYESGLPVSDAFSHTDSTLWGRVPAEKSVVYSFSNESGARQKQDVGLNGLSDKEEREFGIYADYLKQMKDKVAPEVYSSLYEDPAGDDYHYYRGSDFDANQTSILDRYKRINSPEGNSPNSSESGESYSTAYKTTPDVEDVNQDYTMNEYENFFEYHVNIRPEEMKVGRNFIVDERKTSVKLRNGKTEEATWYQFRIPVDEYEKKVGSISDLSSIRFMRMYLTDFEEPIVLRFASLDLVRGEWRNYTQPLYTGDKPSISGSIHTAAVNIEENNDKTPVNYVLPPGITRVIDPQQRQLTQNNEQALSITVEDLASGDARAVYKTMNQDLRKYKHVQMFVHANALEGQEHDLQDNQMSVFIRLGSDYKSNYYEYEIPLKLTAPGHYDTYTTSGCEAVWPEENMLDIDFNILTEIKHKRNKAKASNGLSYTQMYYDYDPNRPNNKISVIGNPSLGEVKTMMIGVRNNGRKTNSVEVWVNELRLQDYNNEGGYAAQGNLSMQLSDLGSINLAGHMETAGYGGLEENVASRRDDNLYEWNITTNIELGKLFPDKWKMNLPLYYSYSWQKVSPKYNPFDTDMLLKDALNECESSFARDSLSNLTETIVKTKNLSLSNWKSNYTSPRPMPFDPANFAVSYSYSQRYKTGETIVYENDENWKANFSYNYSPKYKTWEPFKKIKGKSKWLDIIKAQNLNYLPQSISFNTDLTRNYYEFQERDIDAGTQLPVVFSEQFLWNRQFNIRWDIFKALRLSYTSATHAEIEEPYTVINKSLYPDAYEAWKDSVKHSLASFGRPLTYNSTFTGSYNLPLNKIPLLDWISADGSYNASYHWNRGTELEDGTSLGHMANTQRTININSKINFETLYKKWSFLEKTEQRFSSNSRNNRNRTTKDTTTKKNSSKNKNDAASDNNKAAKEQTSNKNQKNGKSSTTNVTLNDSTNTELTHGFNTRRIIVKATTESGKSYDLKYKRVDANKISIKNQDTIPLKVTITPKQPLEEKGWYKSMQVIARGLMMIRNANITYRNSYSLALPGLKNEIGDAFGQKSINGILSPGLDFAFGAVGDSYVNKAIQNGWLIDNDSSITTPITTNASEDIQVRMTLEPLRDLKIDLNATRVVNKSKSIRYMYAGMPVTQSGSFSMTVISASSAFANRGNIDNNYNSQPFNDFIKNIDIIQNRLENAYSNTTYPIGSGEQFEGKPYDPANGGIDKYSADVMVPAFLAAYCNNDARKIPLKIFPALLKMMPNWSVSYSGLSKLPWFANKFRSFNINHAYKSIYTVGAYNSFTNYMAFMGDMGFIMDVTTGNPIPNSMYNVNTVSINEAFSPLIGVDMTFNNGLTTRMEYRKTRTLNLSMTSVALTENYSDDIVVGFGYKIKDLNLFGAKNIQSGEKSKKSNKKNSKNKNESENDSSNKNSKSKTRVGGISHDLNLRLDFSYRMQNALNRNIQTQMTTATNGSTAYKLAMSADYVFSNLLTLSGFLDWQKNVPLVSTSSYPTTTADFGISMKFSLTR